MKRIILSLLALFFIASLFVPIRAQVASSASQLRDSVKLQVANELAQIKKAVSKKAFLGAITAKSEATLTLSNNLNQNRSVVVSADTVIKLKTGADGTPADLKINDYILVMGDVDSVGNMTAKRLLVIPPPDTDKRTVTYGKVLVVGPTITVDKFTAKLASDSYITTTLGGKTVKKKTTDIKAGDTVIMITKTSTSSPIVTDLYIYPSTVPTATPSASPT